MRNEPRSKAKRYGNVVLGGVLALATSVTGIGAALGGWVAGRGFDTPVGGGLAGGVAGLLGAAPVAGLVYLAGSGAVDSIGYHEGGVHVGVNALEPGRLVLWQELGLAALVATVLVSVAVLGGVAAGLGIDSVDRLRTECVDARSN